MKTEPGQNSKVLMFGGSSDERLVSVASSQNLCVHSKFTELWFFHFDGSISRVTTDELRGHERPFEVPFQPKASAFAPSLASAVNGLRGRTVFLGFHGSEGEDGKIQALLESQQISFTGSGSISSANCFDKSKAKEIVARQGGRVAEQITIDVSAGDRAEDDLRNFFERHRRIVVKPVASGSSFGLFIVLNKIDLEKAAAGIRSLPYGHFLCETFIEGRELTVGVWDRSAEHETKPIALPASEVIMNAGRNFDYEGKYLGKGSTEVTPADISESEMAEAHALALTAHRALKCYGYSRTDMILTAEGPVFLETNTLPGMTRASFYPQQLQAAGFEMSAFVAEQLSLAERRFS